jgi:hypothetical protein
VSCCAVVELRQYTLRPGKRDDLIDLFDEHFVESQEAVGMTVIGQFRDRRRPDRFVWLRGFPDMESRHASLEAFYGGPVWAARAAAANDTMLAWDDVLLLKPLRPETAFDLRADGRRASHERPATVLVGIHRMGASIDAEFVTRFEREVAPALEANEVRIEGVFVTETAPNTFARLPVREGERVLAWFGTVEERAHPPGWLERLDLPATLGDRLDSLLYLDPTARSRLGRRPSTTRA